MATRDADSPWPSLGSFRVNPAALDLGREALSPEAVADRDIVVVDEVGPWELAGEGWSQALEAILRLGIPVLLVVRRELLDDALARWAPHGPPVWDVIDTSPKAILESVQGSLEEAVGVR
jgi:nucleoside-triphosphatase THEP1